jgi:chemotaxis signal transduction protein
MSDQGATIAPHSNQTVQLLQGIRCGTLAVAFPYGWASTIVEKFELTPVPKAPAWLVGATNIDGRITPVIDLSRYGARGQRAERSNAGAANVSMKRLLVGGLEADQGDRRFAIAFNGLPQQIRRFSSEADSATTMGNSSSAMTDGFALSAQGERYAVVNVDRLFEQLATELSTV